MNKNYYVGITDTNWMSFIIDKKRLNQIGNEINFWRPGSQKFRALKPGDLFVFKLHMNSAKREKGEIVGAGYYVGFERMTPDLAWQRFEYGNGAESKQHMLSCIDSYRAKNNMEYDNTIGCIIVEKAVFFEPKDWIESPNDWGKFIVSGKKYSLDNDLGNTLYEKIINTMRNYQS